MRGNRIRINAHLPATLRKHDLRKPNCQADLQQGDTPNTPLFYFQKTLRAKLARSENHCHFD